MRPFRLSFLLCLFLGACGSDVAEPLAPGATGMIDLDPAIDPSSYQTLEIRGFPETAESSFDGSIPTDPGLVRAKSLPLDDVMFPLEYAVGGESIGETGLPRFRVVAWLSDVPDSDAPAPGDPQGTTSVALLDCSGACEDACYCGIGRIAAVRLARAP